MKIVLIGQPNSGKSTIFNSVIGYKSISSNISGVTVDFTIGKTTIDFETVDVVDLPGMYTFNSSDVAESLTINYLLNSDDDFVIINVIDASVLSRSLELTLQLLELKKPLVIALNMSDDAEKKGIQINSDKLKEILGVPVIKTIATKGVGISELFNTSISTFKQNILPKSLSYTAHSEKFINEVSNLLSEIKIEGKELSRFYILKYIEQNTEIVNRIEKFINKDTKEQLTRITEEFEKNCNLKIDLIYHRERHDLAFQLFELVSKIGTPPSKDILSKLDNLFLHPVYGYISLIMILFLMFEAIFSFGGLVEPVFVDNFGNLSAYLSDKLGNNTLTFTLINGFIIGLSGGLVVVIPYLIPFFFILAFLEDSGYLARIAYLLDNLMHRIGLHGMSIIPLILGYGCSVPAIISTRILKSKKDKLITATLASLIPCTARMTTIFALVGFFISMYAAVLIYFLNLIVIAITGKLLSKKFNEISPGFILEMPKYHPPAFKVIIKKSWFRLKEFVIIAWPLLIIGSIILEFITYFNLSGYINEFLSPFTVYLLGLPSIIGITLIFGIMRKELTVVLLFSVLGTTEVSNYLNHVQIFIYTVFISFYVPCLATFAALSKEISLKNAVLVSLFSFALAILIANFIRLLGFLF